MDKLKYHKTVLVFILCILFFSAGAQNASHFYEVLREIAENNRQVASLQKAYEAEAAETRTGFRLENPEVEFGYLWGSPTSMGNRVDLNFRQSFDFPTAYTCRKKMADARSEQLQKAYEAQRMTLDLAVADYCFDLIYNNIMHKILQKRVQYTQKLSEIYQLRFEKGDCSILELNKIKMHSLNAGKALYENTLERSRLQKELIRCNGGKNICLEDTIYPEIPLPENFEQLLSDIQGPETESLQAQQNVRDWEVRLKTAESLPRFSVGYQSERILGTTLQGASVSMSIPLWENKGCVRAARSARTAADMAVEDSRVRFRNQMEYLYEKNRSLKQWIEEYREVLKTTGNMELWQIALDKGQINLTEYLLETDNYLEMLSQILESEKEYQFSLFELSTYASAGK